MSGLGHLIARERDLIDEWNWLFEAVYTAAEVHAKTGEQGLVPIVTTLLARLDALDRRRVDLSLAIAHHPEPPHTISVS